MACVLLIFRVPVKAKRALQQFEYTSTFSNLDYITAEYGGGLTLEPVK